MRCQPELANVLSDKESYILDRLGFVIEGPPIALLPNVPPGINHESIKPRSILFGDEGSTFSPPSTNGGCRAALG